MVSTIADYGQKDFGIKHSGDSVNAVCQNFETFKCNKYKFID